MGRTKGSGAGSFYKLGKKCRGQMIVDGKRISYTASYSRTLSAPKNKGPNNVRNKGFIDRHVIKL